MKDPNRKRMEDMGKAVPSSSFDWTTAGAFVCAAAILGFIVGYFLFK